MNTDIVHSFPMFVNSKNIGNALGSHRERLSVKTSVTFCYATVLQNLDARTIQFYTISIIVSTLTFN